MLHKTIYDLNYMYHLHIFIFRSHYNETQAVTVETSQSATLTYDRFYTRGRITRLDEPSFEIRLE